MEKKSCTMVVNRLLESSRELIRTDARMARIIVCLLIFLFSRYWESEEINISWVEHGRSTDSTRFWLVKIFFSTIFISFRLNHFQYFALIEVTSGGKWGKKKMNEAFTRPIFDFLDCEWGVFLLLAFYTNLICFFFFWKNHNFERNIILILSDENLYAFRCWNFFFIFGLISLNILDLISKYLDIDSS